MKTIGKLKIGMMGVVNTTPDSFSDGGQFNTPESFKRQLEVLKDVDILDIGAESTAPFANPITAPEESDRLTVVDFEAIKAFPKVSIDSYHLETVRNFAENYRGPGELIWNDVSGVFGEKTRELLEEFPQMSYVFSHTHVPDKSQTSFHMEYLGELNVAEKFRDFLDHGLKYKVYLDPCFGFSKTREQNHELIEQLPELIREFEHDFIIGISRKSFLRFTDLPKDDPQLILETEVHQSVILSKLIDQLKDLDRTIYFRMHDPVVYNALTRF